MLTSGRRSVSRRILPLLAAGALTVPLSALAAAPAHAATGPTASVSLGDSYISGEAGRWQGNSDDTATDRDGTDRAWNGSSYNPAAIYGATYASGCDRSDSAEIHSAAVAQTQINLACSGATSTDVISTADGGQSYKGEAPQADQLAGVAANNNVKLITLSVGGNDLGFADVITTCAKDYLIWYSYCHDDQQSVIDAKMPAAMAGVTKSIESIRTTMTNAGYAPGSYRFVLQSYPSPIPRSSEMRYPESGWSRASTGGCPFWDADADWARDTVIPEISDHLAAVAQAEGVEFLDLRDVLQGREVCAQGASMATSTARPSATTSEWARFVDTGMSTSQGSVQESMHPNYYGQQALGRCLSLEYANPGNHACLNTPGTDSSGMYLTAR